MKPSGALDDARSRRGMIGGSGLTRGALRELDKVLQQDRHADGGDQRGQPEGAAQRPVGNALDRPAVEPR